MPEVNVLSLNRALMCLDCKALHDAPDGICPRCASNACYAIEKWLERDNMVLEVPEWVEAFV